MYYFYISFHVLFLHIIISLPSRGASSAAPLQHALALLNAKLTVFIGIGGSRILVLCGSTRELGLGLAPG